MSAQSYHSCSCIASLAWPGLVILIVIITPFQISLVDAPSTLTLQQFTTVITDPPHHGLWEGDG